MSRFVKQLVLLLVLALWLVPLAAQNKPTKLPNLSDTEIKLDWDDFKNLVESTYIPDLPPVPVPTDSVLRSAEYRAILSEGLITLEGTLTLEVLKKGWVTHSLGSLQAVVSSFDGGSALLERRGSEFRIISQGPATHKIKITFVLAAPGNPGANQVYVQLPDAALNLVDLSLNKPVTELSVRSGLKVKTQGDHTWVALQNGRMQLGYQLPFSRAADVAGTEVELDPRVNLNAYQFLNLGDGVLGGLLVHDYDVRVAEVSAFEITVPKGIEVFDASAPSLESWKILERENKRILRLNLLAPVKGHGRVVVTFEGSYDRDKGELDVPRFTPLAVERESGFVILGADGAELALALSGNLLPADVTEIPAEVVGFGINMVSALKYSGPPSTATVQITEHEDAQVLTAIIEEMNATTLKKADGTEMSWINLVIKNNRKQFLKCKFSNAGMEVLSLEIDGETAKPKRTGDEILVPLPSGLEVTTRVKLVLLNKGEPLKKLFKAPGFQMISSTLPAFDLPVLEALWSVFLPEKGLYNPDSDTFKTLKAPNWESVQEPVGSFLSLDLGETSAEKNYMPIKPRAMAMLSPQDSEADLELYSGVVSEEMAQDHMEQKKEAMKQQFRANRSASRSGSRPVSVRSPDGMRLMPQITVSAMIMLANEPHTLEIKVVPEWAPRVVDMLQLALLLLGCLFLAMGLAAKDKIRRYQGFAILALALILVYGSSLGTGNFLLLVILLTVAAWIVLASAQFIRNYQAKQKAAKKVTEAAQAESQEEEPPKE